MCKKCDHKFVSFTKNDKTNMLCQWCGLPKPKVYTIEQLKWTYCAEYGWQSYSLIGEYAVKPDSWCYAETGNYVSIDAKGSCTSIEDGKKKAQEHYETILRKCLKEVKDV